MSPERVFVAESLAALEAAVDYPTLHQVFAERVTALVLDHGNLAEVRALAEAWRIRHRQLLNESLEGERP